MDTLLERYYSGEEEEEYALRKLVEQVNCFNDL